MTAVLEKAAPRLEIAWRLDPSVAVRQEAFGAMTYHFGSRRLSFLKSRRLATVVGTLSDHPTALAACRAAGVSDAEMPAYAEAIGRLADAGILVCDPSLPRTPLPHPAPTSGSLRPARGSSPLADRFQEGLAAPICITWELTYACNLACVHCLSSSGRRDPRELSSAECRAVIDELERLQVFYVNIGGGEPTVRRDFWDLLDYATDHHVGVKFSTNGTRITPTVARRLAGSDYVDVQISLDGATAAVNDAVRGEGSYEAARGAMANLAEAGFENFKLSSSPPATTSTSSTTSCRWPTTTAPSSASPDCDHPGAAPTSGTTCTRRRSNSAGSTTGCSTAASGCSPATRSSTSRATERRFPGSISVAPGGWCA